MSSTQISDLSAKTAESMPAAPFERRSPVVHIWAVLLAMLTSSKRINRDVLETKAQGKASQCNPRISHSKGRVVEMRARDHTLIACLELEK